MFEIASQMIVYLLIALLIGYIIGYLSSNKESNEAIDHNMYTKAQHINKEARIRAEEEVKALVQRLKTVEAKHIEAEAKAQEEIKALTEQLKAEETQRIELEAKAKEEIKALTEQLKTEETQRIEAEAKAQEEIKALMEQLKTKEEAKHIEPEAKALEKFNPIDDITRIKGLGPKTAKALGMMGITTFDHIIALTDEDKITISKKIHGRLNIDKWASQAQKIKAEDAQIA